MRHDSQGTLGAFDVFVAGVALVVAASTLVSELTGFITYGWLFAIPLFLAFTINLLLGLSAATLSHRSAGEGLFDFALHTFAGPSGTTIGLFLAVSFIGMSALALAGEATAGAAALGSLLGVDWPPCALVIVCFVCAATPGFFGLRAAAWASTGLLIVMLGLRWVVGVAGFLGLGDSAGWSLENMTLTTFSEGGTLPDGLMSEGLTLAIWSFIGIEFACMIRKELRRPERSLPIGIVAGLTTILLTSLFMGLGVAGALPLEKWQRVATSSLAAGGDAPQVAVGQVLLGEWGVRLMAVASFAATQGSLTVALVAIPRLLQRISQETRVFGRFAAWIGHRTARGIPSNAMWLTVFIFMIPAALGDSVVHWIFSAAYLWLVLYVVHHLLVLCRSTRSERHLPGSRAVRVLLAGIGAGSTVVAIVVGFQGSHGEYGVRAAAIAFFALVIVLAPRFLTALRRLFRADRTADETAYDSLGELDQPSA